MFFTSTVDATLDQTGMICTRLKYFHLKIMPKKYYFCSQRLHFRLCPWRLHCSQSGECVYNSEMACAKICQGFAPFSWVFLLKQVFILKSTKLVQCLHTLIDAVNNKRKSKHKGQRICRKSETWNITIFGWMVTRLLLMCWNMPYKMYQCYDILVSPKHLFWRLRLGSCPATSRQ